MFPLCHSNAVPHHGGEDNLIRLDILLSNPPFSPPSEAFSKLTPTVLFIRAENPTCAAFLISCGHIKGRCTPAQTLSENGDWQLRAKAGTNTLGGIYISGCSCITDREKFPICCHILYPGKDGKPWVVNQVISAQCPQRAAGLSRLLSSHLTERNKGVQKTFSDIRSLPLLHHGFYMSGLKKCNYWEPQLKPRFMEGL